MRLEFKRGRAVLTIGWLALVASVTPVMAADAPSVDRETGGTPAAVQELRRRMLDADVNSLFFHNMDELFDTRVVTRAGPVTEFPREDFAPPELKYDGEIYSYDEFADVTKTNAFLIIRDGKIIFEDYRNNTDADTRFIAFSMSKSITSMLIGIALDKGAIRSVDDLAVVYAPELRDSGYDGVTIRQILEMRSGVDYEERYDFGESPSLAAVIHENAVVQNRERFVDRAKTVGRKAEPGSRFNYATLDTAVLGRILEAATGQSISKFMSEYLWEPAGMEYSGFWIADGAPGVGRELNGMGYNASLRDFGRLGQLMLNGGVLGGRRILSEEWVRASTDMKPYENAAVGGEHGAYGYQWWKLDDRPGSYMAIGLQGQFIYVDPRSKTVVVKLSFFPPGADDALTALTLAYFDKVARWAPQQKH